MNKTYFTDIFYVWFRAGSDIFSRHILCLVQGLNQTYFMSGSFWGTMEPPGQEVP